MSRFTASTRPKSLASRYSETAWGIRPTSMYSLKRRSALRCSGAGRGERSSAEERMRFARASSPQAQRNSSKPSGFSLRGVSSEGITMPSTFLRIEMSDPVSR